MRIGYTRLDQRWIARRTPISLWVLVITYLQ
jgi:hypothetical protein